MNLQDRQIRYWVHMLDGTMLAESKSILLDELVKDFGSNVVFNVRDKVSVDTKFATEIFNSLNEHFFNPHIKNIEIKSLSFEEICAELLRRETEKKDIPNKNILGVHNVLMENQPLEINWSSPLILHSEIIMMNRDQLDNRTFIFNVASICHEMIHQYDMQYGEYQDTIKFECITKNPVNIHTTPTFKRLMNLANLENVKVIPEMYTNDVNVLDYDAAMELFNSIDETADAEALSAKNLVDAGTHISITSSGKACINHYD